MQKPPAGRLSAYAQGVTSTVGMVRLGGVEVKTEFGVVRIRKRPPAKALGITDHIWDIGELIEVAMGSEPEWQT